MPRVIMQATCDYDCKYLGHVLIGGQVTSIGVLSPVFMGNLAQEQPKSIA